jgi:DNA transformation protein
VGFAEMSCHLAVTVRSDGALALNWGMTASAGFIELLEDALSGLGPVSVRRMFGGAGVYADGVMFGLVADDTLYLKADDATQRAFAAEGLEPFVYEGRGRKIAMSYWRIPERLLDDPDEMVAWARAALGVARRAAAARPTSARKTARKGRSAR